MKDRQPTKPNRVLITPESGSPFYATMTRADEPTEEGTALNKFNLLQDEAAEAFGLTSDAVPNDVFAILGAALPKLGNCEIEFNSYTGTGELTHSHVTYSAIPYAIIIMGGSPCLGIAVRGKPGAYFAHNSGMASFHKFTTSWGETAVTMTAASTNQNTNTSAYMSLNASGQGYNYIALIPKGE